MCKHCKNFGGNAREAGACNARSMRATFPFFSINLIPDLDRGCSLYHVRPVIPEKPSRSARRRFSSAW
ncbi:MAG: hypothetical protein GYA24_07745 [Candidatus Lokiarchaeota archaeon]|nr:hypothetical protein [Candidatus Lokiarchaeota archaeon]